jgi:DNA adenine methylase
MKKQSINKTHITKFLRYPGSKRRILAFLMQHLPEGSDIAGRYFEPFVGSGSVYFSLLPKKAILSDINPDLIDLLVGIKKFPKEVWAIYQSFGNLKRDYEKIRGNLNFGSIQEKAARVLFLNRTCFKGMWRTNKQGQFNVGYGGQDRRWVINEQNLIDVSLALKPAKIKCKDFESVIKLAKPGDFIFLDPPYKPGAKSATNDHYGDSKFDLDDQSRLAEVLKWATKNRIRWAMTNTSHRDVTKLYSGCQKLRLPTGTGIMPGLLVERPGEVLISNYPLKGGRKIS